MYNFKEKKHHFNALRNQDAAGYDLELLEKENPAEPQLETFRRNPKRYADDILYALLDCVSREKIRDNRRNLMEKENLNIEDDGIQSMNAENPDETTSSEDVETRIREAVKAKEEAEARAEEAEEAKEDAEQRAEEAEEAKEDAEQRAEEAEQALEKEKKKAPAKSKSKKSTRT